MNQEVKDFLQTLYNPEEEVCWSTNEKATYSTLQDKIDLENTQLIAINPIKGKRNDVNVIAHRTILVELDEGTLPEQWQYVQRMEMPFSVCIFSGNKSLHFGITVDEDFLSYDVYYWVAQWILNIMALADPNTKNPSRSIRFPGVQRKDGKKKKQDLFINNGRISKKKLYEWLRKFPKLEPKEYEEREVVLNEKDALSLPDWVFRVLQRGVIEGSRNRQYFAVGCEFFKAGYSLEEAKDRIVQYVEFDKDFKEPELFSTIVSAYQYKARN